MTARQNFRLLWLAISTVIVIGIMYVYLIGLEQDRILKLQILEESQAVDLAVRTVRNELERLESDVLFLSTNMAIRRFLEADNSEEKEQLHSASEQAMISLGRIRTAYRKLRVLSFEGQEIQRIDRVGGRLVVAEQGVLQNKSSRPFFQDAVDLPPGKVLVSAFDLNQEFGEVMIPYEPTIRITTTIYSSSTDEPLGLLVLNYSGETLLTQLERIENGSGRELILLNANGDFLKSSHSDWEWGFVAPGRSAVTISNKIPNLWEQILDTPEGFLLSSDTLFAYTRVCDVSTCPQGIGSENSILPSLSMSGSDFPWTIVSQVTNVHNSKFAVENHDTKWISGIILFFSALIGMGAYLVWKYLSTLESLKTERSLGSDKELLLSTLAKFNPAMIFLKNQAGQFILANDAFLKFCGKSWEEVQGKTEIELFGTINTALRIAREQQVVVEAISHSEIENWISESGKTRSTMVSRFPIFDKNMMVESVGTIALDITKHEQIKKQLEESTAKFEAIFNASPDGVIVVAESGEILMANHEADTIFKRGENGLVGMNVDHLVPSKARFSHAGMRQEYLMGKRSGKKMSTQGVTAELPDGSLIDVEIKLTPLTYDGHVTVLAVIRDVTQRKKINAHLQHSSKMDSVGQLAGTIAHDFNNLLGVIIGSLDLVQQTFNGDEKNKRRIGIAFKAATTGSELTKRLLSVSRKNEIHASDEDIGQIIRDLVPLLKQSLPHEIKLQLKVDDVPLNALVDRSEIENVFLNLCVNARDAMPDGGIITFEATEVSLDEHYFTSILEPLPAGRYVHIGISDTGTGIPKELLSKIFEPFFSTKKKGKGTGLGLAQVDSFVKQSGGLIKVYSESGIGTTFHIYLPSLASVRPPSSTDLNKDVEEEAGTESILVVDDNKELAEIGADLLKELGYQVYWVTSGELALNYLASNSVDLVITDIFMPGGMGGVELRTKINKDYPEIKVVYTTGASEQALKAGGIDTENVQLIVKPFRKNNFAAAIRRAFKNLPNDL